MARFVASHAHMLKAALLAVAAVACLKPSADHLTATVQLDAKIFSLCHLSVTLQLRAHTLAVAFVTLAASCGATAACAARVAL